MPARIPGCRLAPGPSPAKPLTWTRISLWSLPISAAVASHTARGLDRPGIRTMGSPLAIVTIGRGGRRTVVVVAAMFATDEGAANAGWAAIARLAARRRAIRMMIFLIFEWRLKSPSIGVG